MTVGEVARDLDRDTWQASHRFARYVSDLLSPPVFAVLILLVGMWASGWRLSWRYGLVYAVGAMVIPLLDLTWLVRSGRVSDVHLADRRDRRRPFLVTIACSLAVYPVLLWWGAPPLMLALLRAAFLQSAILLAITLVWQGSVHAAAAASFTTVVLMLGGSAAAPVILLLPVVGWARLHLRRHSPTQVVVGMVIGVLATAIALHGWI